MHDSRQAAGMAEWIRLRVRLTDGGRSSRLRQPVARQVLDEEQKARFASGDSLPVIVSRDP